MINRIMTAAFARPAFTILVVLIAAGFGAVSFQQLRRDVFPDFQAQHPGIGYEQMHR